MSEPLQQLHSLIDKCRVCESFAKPLIKPATGMDRGEGREIFIVGQAPGRTEVSTARAFSGPSGRRLDTWLISSGRPREDPRRGVYLTSILKCALAEPRYFKRMAQQCRHFLESQLEIIRPKLVITLGRESFEYLRIDEGTYDSLIGNIQYPADHPLMPEQPFSAILHWPHPSGLNRWHNGAGNADRLQESFISIRKYLEGQQ